MSDDSIVCVDVDGRADLYHFSPVATYEGEKLPDGTIVLRPLKEPGRFARRFEPRPLDADDSAWGGDPQPGVTMRPIYADEWRNRGLN